MSPFCRLKTGPEQSQCLPISVPILETGVFLGGPSAGARCQVHILPTPLPTPQEGRHSLFQVSRQVGVGLARWGWKQFPDAKLLCHLSPGRGRASAQVDALLGRHRPTKPPPAHAPGQQPPQVLEPTTSNHSSALPKAGDPGSGTACPAPAPPLG